MLAGDFTGIAVHRLPVPEKRQKREGAPREPKRIGKIHHPVFSPEGTRVVGFMLRLPDIAGMIKQPDRFIALDAIGVSGDVMVAKDDRAAFDAPAAKRLGVNLDDCLIWTGMDVRTVSGKPVGYCADADFNARTGEVKAFILTEGGASHALMGHREMPPVMLKGYRDGAMVVDDGALSLSFSGGAAAKAAEMSVKTAAKATEVTAKARERVKKGASVIDDKGSRALDKGSRALGRQLGKTRGMFGSFVSEYKKAAGTSMSTKKN